jgi:hypothetical protein
MYCTVLGVFNPTMMPNVQCLRYFTSLRYVYVICHFWTPISNVLGYRRHHSICYTCLFTTLLVVTIVSGYNVLWPSDVVSRSGPLISSVLSVRWSFFNVFISVSLLYLSVVFSHLSLSLSRCLFYVCPPLCLSSLKSSICAWNRRHLLSRLHFPLLRFRNNLVA